MKFKFLKACFLTLAVLAANLTFAQAVNNRGFVLKDEGIIVGFVRNLDIVSSMASCGIVNGDGVCTFTPPSTTLTAGSTVTSGFASPGLLGSSSNLLMAYTLSGTGTVIPTTASPTFTGTLTAATVTSSGGFYTYVGGSGVGFLGGASAFTPDNPRIQLFGSGLGGGMALHITGFDTAGNSYDYQNPCFAGLGTTACPDPTLSLHSIAASTTQAFSLGHNGTQGFLVANGGILARSLTYASGSDVALTLQGSLSGNIMNLKNSAGTTLSYFDSAGKFVAPDATGYQFASSVGGGYGINYRSASNQIEIIHGANAFFGVNTAVGTVVSTDGVSFSSATVNAGSVDTRLQREAAATLQMGADVNGAAVNQTLKAHDGITGTNISGANLTIAAGRGTGAGTGGTIAFQTAPVIASGTTAQTLTDRLTISKDGTVAFPSGKLNVDLGGGVLMSSRLSGYPDYALHFGTSGGVAFGAGVNAAAFIRGHGTVAGVMQISPATATNYIEMVEVADARADYNFNIACITGLGTSGCTDPTFSIRSANQATNQALSLGHNRTQGVITANGGVLARSLTYASGSDVGLTVQCSLTGNCYEVKNSAGTAIFSFSSGANLVWPSGSPSLQANEASGIFTIRVGGATNNNALVLDANSGDTKLSSYTQKNRYTLSYAASSTSAINSSHIFDTSPGNTSAGFGVGLLARGQSSTTASQDMALFGGVWTTATHASRTSKAVAQTVNNAGSLTTTWDAQNGHDRTVGTAPAVSACGTSPSAVTGSDGNGRFTVGSTGTVTSCTLTFAIAYNVAPACIANNETALELVRAVATTTTLTIDGTDITTDTITYICRGN